VLFWLINVALAIGMIVWLASWQPPAHERQSGLFPQNQYCQSDADALRIRFPYRPSVAKRYSPLVPDSEASVRSVTNCHPMSFRFFATNLEVTHLHYMYVSGSIKDKYYATNRDNMRDVIVHVEFVQPATSILDPTISTNRDLLSYSNCSVPWCGSTARASRLTDMTWIRLRPTSFSSKIGISSLAGLVSSLSWSGNANCWTTKASRGRASAIFSRSRKKMLWPLL
jgi:hypothetical protein